MYVSIQYLRGIAATAIVLKHASHPGGALQVCLDAGVDLFFVISGFVMVVSTAGRNMTATEFIGKRCRRILPMWWLTLCLVGILGLGVGGWDAWMLSFPLIPHDITPSGVSIVYWGIGWSLVFEAVFYALFAFGLAFRTELFINFSIPALVVAGVVFDPSNPVLNTATHPLLIEFLLGVLAARLVLAGLKPSILLVPLGILLWVLSALTSSNPELRGIVVGIPMAMIVAGLAIQTLPEIKPLRLLGDASYSIYLIHYVPIMLAWTIVPKDSYWPLTFGLAIALGILAYWFIEKPLLDLMRRVRLQPAF